MGPFRNDFGPVFVVSVIALLILIVEMQVEIAAFSVSPLGLSGKLGNLDLSRTGKSHNLGVSWSMNLDAEIKQRKSLCPNIPVRSGYQYRYHNETQACYKIGDKGPCGDNMIFFAYQTNAVYGQCDCNYNDNTRALIMSLDQSSCHFAYSKGYCRDGEWLTFSPTWDAVCEPNVCLKFYDHVHDFNAIIPPTTKEVTGKAVSIEFIPYRNSKGTYSCVPLGLSCQDKDMDEDSVNKWGSLAHLPHEVQFIKGKLDPRCGPRSDLIHWRHPTPKMQCLPGSYLMTVAKQECNHQFDI